jgi:hypothetical protein
MSKEARRLGQDLLRSMIGLENSKPIADILASLEALEDTNLENREEREAKNDENSPS